MEYIYTGVKTKEELEFQIEYYKNYQFEKFKNNIDTNNWNNMEIIIDDTIFVSPFDLKYYAEQNYKDNSLLCLKLYHFDQYINITQTGQELNESILNLEDEISNFYENVINRTKEQKSLTKSCNECKSIIKIEHINDVNCPICGNDNFLFTETDKQSLESKNNRLSKHKESLEDKIYNYDKKNKRKIEKYLNNELSEEEANNISFEYVIVEKKYYHEDLSFKLKQLKVKSYQITKEIIENKKTIENNEENELDDLNEIVDIFNAKLARLKNSLENNEEELENEKQ